MSLEIILSFVVTLIMSIVLVPIVGRITKELGIIAQVNNRTVHKGIIPRTGGYAIYVSFLLGAMIFLKTDIQINSILIGGFIIFITGFLDDIYDLKPKYKLLGQILAALVVIVFGSISLKGFTIPFLPSFLSYIIAIIITIGWIVGITNAVNLIDGLDGLCAGISIIVLCTISITSLHYGRTDISSLSLLLAGSIGGFLVFNFHPASIFMGDCGALFIGYMISVISLLGFGYKSSSFFTLGAPIVVLMVPIMDTLIAIVRRKVQHKRFSDADKSHLHHKLMFSLELGQTKSVLTLYGATILFSLCSYLYLYNKVAAALLFLGLMFIFEIFVEATNMIDRKYKPVLTILNIFIKSEYLPSIKDTKPYRRFIARFKTKYLLAVICVIAILITSILIVGRNDSNKKEEPIIINYVQQDNQTTIMGNVYNQLESAISSGKREKTGELVGIYFICDYYTLKYKAENEIGGVDYLLKEKKDDFITYAKDDYYKDVNNIIAANLNSHEVESYNVLDFKKSIKAIKGLEDYTYYDLSIEIVFQEYNPIIESQSLITTVTLIDKDQKFFVVALGE